MASTRPSHTVPPVPSTLFRLFVVLAVASAPAAARAGGGPESVFLVVNSASPDSLAVGNAFAALRGVPPINVLMLPWEEGTESVSIDSFRTGLLAPVLRAIDSRNLSTQIDCVVWSADFPWRIDFAKELPQQLVGRDKYPSGSLTGMTMMYVAVQNRRLDFLEATANRYWRPTSADGVPLSTDGFRGWYGWGPQGELMEAGGRRYLLSVMLGVTSGRGNSVGEVVRYLGSAAAADGTRPTGTVYFASTGDVRTTTRSGPFAATVKELKSLGVAAEVVEGPLPVGKRDVAGLMLGAADFDWPRSGSTILPGAICENLTSYGGIFTPSVGQTPLSALLRAGAAGSSGTVIEPYALQAKFPHASIQVHYARGASLAEAFYQSVRSPYQLLVVGDPLCQPWANIPRVEAVLAPDLVPIEADAVLSGTVEIEPRATVPGEGIADRFELFVDGLRVARCVAGGRFSLDTSGLADGYHELRCVAVESSPVESQGRWIGQVMFANHGRRLALAVEPRRVKPSGTVRVSVSGEGVDGVAVFSMGRVLGRTSGADSTIEVPADLLGLGRVTIRATGRCGEGAAGGVNARPVVVEVTDRP